MDDAPQIRDVTSWIDARSPLPAQLVAIAAVETPASNAKPCLRAVGLADPDQTTLSLQLTIHNDGEDAVGESQFHPVRFEIPASAGPYEKVQFLWEGGVITEAPIEDTH